MVAYKIKIRHWAYCIPGLHGFKWGAVIFPQIIMHYNCNIFWHLTLEGSGSGCTGLDQGLGEEGDPLRGGPSEVEANRARATVGEERHASHWLGTVGEKWAKN